MWIRSQNEEILLNLDCVVALKYNKWYGGIDEHGPVHGIVAFIKGGECYDFELGRYFTEKRAYEVLEEIEDEITEENCSVYYMPQE